MFPHNVIPSQVIPSICRKMQLFSPGVHSNLSKKLIYTWTWSKFCSFQVPIRQAESINYDDLTNYMTKVHKTLKRHYFDKWVILVINSDTFIYFSWIHFSFSPVQPKWIDKMFAILGQFIHVTWIAKQLSHKLTRFNSIKSN